MKHEVMLNEIFLGLVAQDGKTPAKMPRGFRWVLGEYLDLPKFRPIFEAAEALGLPLYLHPCEPSPAMLGPFADYGLYFAGWGFAAETGVHAMRITMCGVLDRFPKLKIVLGHMGEGIPFWLQRIDNRYLLQVRLGAVRKMARLPSVSFLSLDP